VNDSVWPTEDIEIIGACPICAGTQRTLAHGELVDRIFFAAPGNWQLWRCDGCGAGYLDPRPSHASIGRAYGAYYTHDQALPEAPGAERLGLLARLKRAALNDFFNAHLGYRLRPALPLGRLAFAIRPDKARAGAEMVRHLPAPRSGDRLLDVGCGSGGFLLLARDRLGYAVEGTELDTVTAARAAVRGITIHAAPLPGMGLPDGRYTQVTMNHVLEHVHDPISALREIFSALVPGGRVWVQVPNLNGASHVRFGADSRLLEPPRHLVIFTPDALRAALQAVGFVDIARLPVENLAPSLFAAGWMIASRVDPAIADAPAPPPDVIAAGLDAKRRFSGVSDEAEVFTMIGFRPLDV
jgi:SAM-dependent methyltransferase